MTPEQIRNAAAVMAAAAEGKPIEIFIKDTWHEAILPIWDWSLYDYRVKQPAPEPRSLWVLFTSSGHIFDIFLSENHAKAVQDSVPGSKVVCFEEVL